MTIPFHFALVRAATAAAATAFFLALAFSVVFVHLAFFLVECLLVRTVAQTLLRTREPAAAHVDDVSVLRLHFCRPLRRPYNDPCHNNML